MSADLFAAFGSDPRFEQQAPAAQAKPVAPPSARAALFGSLTPSPASTARPPAQLHQPAQQSSHFREKANPQPAVSEEENDDWGDFEGGSSVETSASIPQQMIDFPPSSIGQPQQPSWTAPTQADAFYFNATTQGDRSSTFGWQSAPIVKAKKPADSAILFDAEEDDDDDDFGDFEGINETATPTTSDEQSALVDLMGDMSMSQPQPKPAATAMPGKGSETGSKTTAKKKNLEGGFGDTAQFKPKPANVEVPTSQVDDGWDTFDDWEASTHTKPAAKAEPPKSMTPAPDVKAVAQLSSATLTFDEPQPGELPPTNVPPPGVLLSLFPSLFNEAQEKLFKPMAALSLPMRNKLMADPATIKYLQGYLVLADVVARLIAGRKLRWKRDQHLSQGMRIGPASSRATSGMKLTGIDKAENMKEEREVADVVRVWKDQVGRLRHVVSGVNQIKNGTLGTVPDLSEVLPVKTLKQNEGGVPARTPCMLCGLKREERVTVGDLKTEDSFGEWWVDEASMHRGELSHREFK